jgi:hypothetical protein
LLKQIVENLASSNLVFKSFINTSKVVSSSFKKMGWDLVPRNQGVEGFHANISGWNFIFQALQLLKADLTKFGETNDGVFVPEATARQWATLLLDALLNKKINEIPATASGFSSNNLVLAPKGRPLEQRDLDFLARFMHFCLVSGGFEQW